MAAETMTANKIMNRILLNGDIQEVQAVYVKETFTPHTGADIKAGDVVNLDASSTTGVAVDLQTGSEPYFGIVLDYNDPLDYKANYSIGVTIPIDTAIKVLRPTGGRVTVQVLLYRQDTVSKALAVGDPIWAALTAAGAGKVTNVTPTTLGLAFDRYIGRSETVSAVSVTADKVIVVRY